ncbi:MAG: cold-shock protein [Hyphomicrobiaceae bacterium]
MGRTRPDPSTATSVEGIVKWYNFDKGFGFVSSEDGEEDVFVQAFILEPARIPGLKEGKRVAMQVVKTQKGREAVPSPCWNSGPRLHGKPPIA